MTAVLVFILCTALLLSIVNCSYLRAPIHLAHLVPHSRCDITQLSWHLIWKKKIVIRDVNSREIAFPGLEVRIPGLVRVSNWTDCYPLWPGYSWLSATMLAPGTHEDERTVLYKTNSLDGTKPNTNPNTNPDPKLTPNANSM